MSDFKRAEEPNDLVEAVNSAYQLIQRGVELMPLEQLRQWEGVRGWLESAPIRDIEET